MRLRSRQYGDKTCACVRWQRRSWFCLCQTLQVKKLRECGNGCMYAHVSTFVLCYSDSVTETLHSIRRIRSDKSQHHQLKANEVEVLPASPRLIVTFSPPYAVIDFVFRLRFSIRLAHIQPESNGIAACLAILCICGSRNSVRALHLLSCGIISQLAVADVFLECLGEGGGGGSIEMFSPVFLSLSRSAVIHGRDFVVVVAIFATERVLNFQASKQDKNNT